MNDDKIDMKNEAIDKINESFIKLNKEQFELMKDKNDFNPKFKLNCRNTFLLALGLDIIRINKDLEVIKRNDNRYKALLKLINDIEKILYKDIDKEDASITICLETINKLTYFLTMIKTSLVSETLEYTYLNNTKENKI